MTPRIRYLLLIGLTWIMMLSAVVAAGDTFEATAQQRIVPAGAEIETVWADGDFTEGPVAAADGSILFSDIGNRILRFDPSTKTTTVYRADSGKANGLMFDPDGRLVACEGANGGNRRISVTDADGQVHTLADRFEGKRFNSPNDLAIDRRGRVYFTDPRYVGDEPRELDFEGVFAIQPNGQVTVATREVQKPNGILVSADGNTIYVADNNNDPNGNHHLVRFRLTSSGRLGDKQVLFDFGPNHRGIDGMTLDAEGNIYATAGSGAQAGVYVFAPDGTQLAFIATPGAPTNCVFGIGSDDKTLYITAPAAAAEPGTRPRYGLHRIRLNIAGYRVFPGHG